MVRRKASLPGLHLQAKTTHDWGDSHKCLITPAEEEQKLPATSSRADDEKGVRYRARSILSSTTEAIITYGQLASSSTSRPPKAVARQCLTLEYSATSSADLPPTIPVKPRKWFSLATVHTTSTISASMPLLLACWTAESAQ